MKRLLIIGFGTMHINFGTACMSYAVQHTLLKFGVEGELIKYVPIRIKENFWGSWLLKHKYNYLFGKIVWLLSEYNASGVNHDKRFRFIRFENANLNYAPICYTKDEIKQLPLKRNYSGVMVESDCVWHPFYLNDLYSMEMNGMDIYRFTYAPSMFVSELSEQNQKHIENYKKELRRINRISVREGSAAKILKELVNVDATVVVDPVMLLTKEEWQKKMTHKPIVKGRYIFAYILERNMAARRRVVEMAHLLRVGKVVWLTVGNMNFSYNVYPDVINIDLDGKTDPSGFIRLINDAEYVVTDSFHALNFSIIFQKHFYVFERQNAYWQPDDRVRNLLNTYGLMGQIVDLEEKITETSLKNRLNINYSKVDQMLSTNRSSSMEFIRQCVDEMD